MYILQQSSSFPENVSDSVKELFYRLGPSSSVSPGSASMVFVKTRAAVKLLSVLLATHPMTSDVHTFLANARRDNKMLSPIPGEGCTTD